MDGMEFPWSADFVLETNALESEGLVKWAFAISEDAGNQFVREVGSIAGIAYFGRPAQNGYRISLITSDWQTFYAARQDLCGYAPAYDSISILLVNTRYNLVEAEYVMERVRYVQGPDGIEAQRIETAKVMPAGKGDGEIPWQEIYGVPDDV